MQDASPRTHSRPNLFSGSLLTAGAVILFLGTLFYTRLTWRLGLPALPAERNGALADVLSLGAQRLLLAGGVSFFGDCLLLAACLALARRRGLAGSDLESAGWVLTGVSMALAMVFDSMLAALFWPLAHAADATLFLAVKSWFDFLFGDGEVVFGIGCMAVFWAGMRAASPLLPKLLGWLGVLVGAASAVSGIGYATDLLHWPLVIGFTVTFQCVFLAVLGVQIARSEQTVASGGDISVAARAG
jgi:hypothetical protein